MRRWIGGAALLAAAFAAQAIDIGQVKIAKGSVTIERDGQSIAASPGTRIQAADQVRTGADSSVGITMTDNSLLSAGANSVLVFDRYQFDPTTDQGRFDTSLRNGSLAVVSGRIARQNPEAMTVRTPAVTLGVRGTEFLVTADETSSYR